MTDVQQAYWVGRSASLELGNVSTHNYLGTEFEGIDLERLEFALQRLITRHPMLRTIVRPDGQQQVLETVPPYRIETRDLRQLAEPEKAAALEAIRGQMSHQVLPAHEWPLFEVRAARLSETRVRLHLSYDMLIGDAWSFELLRRELLIYYQQPAAELPELGSDLPRLRGGGDGLARKRELPAGAKLLVGTDRRVAADAGVAAGAGSWSARAARVLSDGCTA